MSVAIMMPSLNLRPRTDVPVTIGCEVCDVGSCEDEAAAEVKDGVPRLTYAWSGVEDHVWPGWKLIIAIFLLPLVSILIFVRLCDHCVVLEMGTKCDELAR